MAQYWEPIQRVLSSAKSILVWVPSEMEYVPVTVLVARDGGEEAGEEAVGLKLLAGDVESGAVGDGGGDAAGDGDVGE